MTTIDTERSRAEHLGPERRRPQMLDAALNLAAQHGLAQVTISAVANALGVSRAVVYACYPGRGELLSALLDRETEVSVGRLMAILPPRKTGSVEQLFVDGFTSLLRDVQARPAPWQLTFAHDADPVLARTISRGREALAAQTAEVMRPLLQRWEVTDLDRVLPVLTAVFLSICESAVKLQLDRSVPWEPEDLAAVVGPAAYRAMRARASVSFATTGVPE